MKIGYLSIRNFKSIKELIIEEIDSAMILVGKNSTGKTVVLDAILAATGMYKVLPDHFNDPGHSIEIKLQLEITEQDLLIFNQRGIISKYKRFDVWKKEFQAKLPSYHDGVLEFVFIVNREGKIRYYDGCKKNNTYIPFILPKIHYLDHSREPAAIQNDIFMTQGQDALAGLRENTCIFDAAKHCNNCFLCMGVISKKSPMELSVFEAAKLLEYKLYHLNMNSFVERLNYYFHKNSEWAQDIQYTIHFDIDKICHIDTLIAKEGQQRGGELVNMSEGTKSIYILSLLEAYIEDNKSIPCIIMIEDPDSYLHPQLQKVASEILYRLSKKNQIIFSTHSPNLIFNFNSKQIKQIILDKDYYTTVNKNTDIDEIINDLGYSANDLLNVSFVFIVEGKQDSSRLPLLLEKYYSEIYDDTGNLQRIAIIPTNSCTNIKTYANLKYMNKLYLKDQFLMIRDGDGKEPQSLREQLCTYYSQRSKEDIGNLPRVQQRNVLILKYYSFENYFLDPETMVKIGIIQTTEDFFNILYQKYQEYLYKLTSVKKLEEKLGICFRSIQDIKDHFEDIRIFVRGHNLFDIFYGRYKGEQEKKILYRYIEAAPRDIFHDILTAIDSFIYFESKKKQPGEVV